MKKVEEISWEQIDKGVKHVALHLQKRHKNYPVNAILGVSRGGLIPAVKLAHLLNIRSVYNINIQTYHPEHKQKLKSEDWIFELPDNPTLQPFLGDGGHGLLIVDDLVDSGTTFELLRQAYPKALYCAVFAKPEGALQANIKPYNIEQDVWLKFPWE